MNPLDQPSRQPAKFLPAEVTPPHPPLSNYYDAMEDRQRFVTQLFNSTARHYRSIEMAAGFGSGLWYRRKALQEAGLTPGMKVLDVACGPGLVTEGALTLVGPAGSVVGLDPSIGMLREAQKGACGNLVRAVGERLPFPDHCFDFLSMGYALRHVPDLQGAFMEYRRVLKPGGIVLLMEISRPCSAPLTVLSRFYIKTVLGRVFSVMTGNRNMHTLMTYWWDTIEHCVPPENVLGALRHAGFVGCTLKEFGGGLLRDYRAVTP